ncbi:phospholipase D-like domain-containing protein [Bacillus sp. S10(2024)]|uniref:phospholipase D-like domain-containing protein n=1 Tax=Bacillus sp. S10(2024) TaxID=3162886 RepID=UPI003D22A54B
MNNVNLSRILILNEEIKDEFKHLSNIEIDEFTKIINQQDRRLFSMKNKMRRIFPNLSDSEIGAMLLLSKLSHDEKEKTGHVEFVATLPTEINTNFRKTISVIRQILNEAEDNILLTGYAVSDFFSEIIEVLVAKSNLGIEVNFYIDNNIKTVNFIKNNLLKHESKIKVYCYKKNDDFSSLHAKVIAVDSKKAFVSSSNLSYNGIINNIEIGNLIEDESVGKINILFSELRSKGYFEKVSIYGRRD